MGHVTFAATGDSFITRRLPEWDQSHQALAAIIGQADVRFVNLETTVHRMEGFPSAQSGGTWAISPPEVLADLKAYGFNLVAWANNHTMDYSYDGLRATKRYLEQYGFVHAGVGDHLAEANEIRYLECRNGRVAFIACTSTFHESWAAGEQRPDMPGRPGVNPLRYTTTYRITEERLSHLKEIAAVTGINSALEQSIKEGFAKKGEDGIFQFGQLRFEASEAEGTITKPHAGDMRRLLRTIGEARRQADYVIVSHHAHEMKGDRKELAAEFVEEFAKACIDEGAHAVIGHGPHIVRGIEIYKKRPIFYSLGNFIFQNDTVSRLPSDFYVKYGLSHDHNTADALEARSNGHTTGLGTNPKVWSSVVADWDMEDGELKRLTLHPIALGFGRAHYRRGWPELTDDTSILETIRKLSEPYGTNLSIDEQKRIATLSLDGQNV